MPTAADPLAAYRIAEVLRACADERLAEVSAGSPNRSLTTFGEIAWDNCECGQLAVGIVRVFPSPTFPAENASYGAPSRPSKCGPAYLVIEYLISIVRCVPSGDENGNPPAATELTAASSIAVEDASAVRAAAICCLQTLAKTRDDSNALMISDFVALDQTFVGPSGLCGGSNLRLLVAINNACPC